MFATEAEGESFPFDELVIFVGVVEGAGGGVGEVLCELAASAVTDGVLAVGELTAVGVESDGAFWVIIFESFGFGEAEADLGGGVVGGMFLHLLVRHQRDFTHVIKFIMKKIKN